jgi:hypothetical protein
MLNLKEGSYYWVKWPSIDNEWTVARRGKGCWWTVGSEVETDDAVSDRNSYSTADLIMIGPEIPPPSPQTILTYGVTGPFYPLR